MRERSVQHIEVFFSQFGVKGPSAGDRASDRAVARHAA